MINYNFLKMLGLLLKKEMNNMIVMYYVIFLFRRISIIVMLHGTAGPHNSLH